jgi:hypothetical protein
LWFDLAPGIYSDLQIAMNQLPPAVELTNNGPFSNGRVQPCPANGALFFINDSLGNIANSLEILNKCTVTRRICKTAYIGFLKKRILQLVRCLENLDIQ